MKEEGAAAESTKELSNSTEYGWRGYSEKENRRETVCYTIAMQAAMHAFWPWRLQARERRGRGREETKPARIDRTQAIYS